MPLGGRYFKHISYFLISKSNKMTVTNFQEVPVNKLLTDLNQPRKFFGSLELAELTASIQAKGVLQPILVRPCGKGKWKVVCGERRFRCAKEAGLKTVPAIIREMDDNEALQLQIVENLQRKSVHAMEEAVAFKELTNKMSLEDIALNVGKSPSYVVKRIKLAELVPDAQEMFFHNLLTHTEALELARMDYDTQMDIVSLVKDYNEGAENISEWERKDNIIYLIERKENSLEDANFDTTCPKLYAEAGACTNCQFNTANTPLLFDEVKEVSCSRPSCFAVKTDRHNLNLIKDAAEDTSTIFIAELQYGGGTDKMVELAKEHGVAIASKDSYEKVYSPDALESKEEWTENNSYMLEDEDGNIDAAEADKKYKEYVEELNEEKAAFEKEIEAGNVIEAVMIGERSIGNKIYIKLNVESREDATENSDEIAGIKKRLKRSFELDAEKVWKCVRELREEEEKAAILFNGEVFSSFELDAIAWHLFKSLSYTNQKVFKSVAGHDGGKFEDFRGIKMNELNSLMRISLLSGLANAYGSHLSNGSDNKIAYDFINQYLPNEINEIEEDQAVIAGKRKIRANQRIAEVKKKIAKNSVTEVKTV